MKKYISKGEWFKKGTEATLVCEITKDSGLFRGIRISEDDNSECHPIGEEYIDEEGCTYDEFDIVEDKK